MNPVLLEIYSTVFTAAPYVIGAYALVWLVLFVYVLVVVLGLRRVEQRMAALEQAVILEQARQSPNATQS
jgi:CcmD family protein